MNLNQVTVYSTDLNEAVPFYQKLGLKLIVDSIPRYVRFECPNGDSTFSIHHAEHVAKEGSPSIYFETQDLDKVVDELQAQGIEFDHMPVDQVWLWREARLKDPDGNQLILFKAEENRKNPPWRIKE